MTPKEYKINLLQSIANHDGQWSWYQLDRMLSANGMISPEPLPRLLREIEQQGLIRSEPGHVPGQPVYYITQTGRHYLDQVSGGVGG